jgi:acid phosphatase (class A)
MKKVLLSAFALVALAVAAAGQSQYSLTQPAPHYATLKTLSAAPSPERAWMDTISFPMQEYSRAALANTLIRTAYLLPEDEAALPSLVSYPANSSEQTRAELDYLLQLQNKRTTQQIGRAQYIAEIGSTPLIINPTDSLYEENRRQLFYIAEPVGPWYNPTNFPATTRLLMNCIQDIRATEFRLKRHFNRARPYHLEPKLKPLARIGSPAFASGHTLWAFSQAYLFAEIIPEQKQIFLGRAEEVRWSRELMGIHFPSDNEASRMISEKLLTLWLKNPKFVADLNAAKEEWKTKNQTFKN